MARNRVHIQAGPEEVFAVLAGPPASSSAHRRGPSGYAECFGASRAK